MDSGIWTSSMDWGWLRVTNCCVMLAFQDVTVTFRQWPLQPAPLPHLLTSCPVQWSLTPAWPWPKHWQLSFSQSSPCAASGLSSSASSRRLGRPLLTLSVVVVWVRPVKTSLCPPTITSATPSTSTPLPVSPACSQSVTTAQAWPLTYIRIRDTVGEI